MRRPQLLVVLLVVCSAIPAWAAQDPALRADRASVRSRVTAAEARLIDKASNGPIDILVATDRFAAQRGVAAAIERANGRVLDRFHAFPVLHVRAGAAAVTALATDDRVVGVQENTLSRPMLGSSVPLINADDVQALGYDGSGTVVAILDTGIDVDHPFFTGRIVSQACYSNATGSGTSLCPNGTNTQTSGNAADAETSACLNSGTNLCRHGSHVAGIAAGRYVPLQSPGTGVAPDARIVAIQVFTRFDSGCPGASPCVLTWTSDYLRGLQRVADLESGGSLAPRHIVAANMSLGGGLYHTPCDGVEAATKTAIDALIAKNIATVIAAGNQGSTYEVASPGCISSAITVGATDDSDAVAGFSNRGRLLDLFAPGVSIDSAVPNNTYATFNGTSMAAPHVTGAWADLRELYPSMSVDQVLATLRNYGKPITYWDGGSNVTTPRIDLLASARPPNDFFGYATRLSGVGPSRTGDTNVRATKQPNEPVHAGNGGGHSVWYYWNPPFVGPVTIDTAGSSFDTLLGVYTGFQIGALSTVASNDDVGGGDVTSRVTFTAVPGPGYWIAVDGYNGATGAVNLNVRLRPVNDDFANAITLSGDAPSRTNDTNEGATKEPGEPNHALVTGGRSVWYAWTPPFTGDVELKTQGSTFNTVLAAYTGTSVGSLTLVDYNDNAGSFGSLIQFTAQAGTTYRIAVDGNNGAYGTVKLQGRYRAPINDSYALASELSGADVSVQGSNAGATKEFLEQNHAGNAGGHSVWYRWTAPIDGEARVDTFGSDIDTLLDVARSSSGIDGAPVASNDDCCGGTSSEVSFSAQAGVEYHIAVDGKNGAQGSYRLRVRQPLIAGCTIIGTPGPDTLSGTTGNDVLCGLGGKDTIRGGEGNDVLRGGDGADRLFPGIGDDDVRGENGAADMVSYSNLAVGVTVDLAISGPQDTGGAGIETLSGIETVTGTSKADTLRGTDANDALYGKAGSDSLVGRGGNDVLLPGGGNDNVVGDAGSDTVSYGDVASAVTVNLSTSSTGGGAGTDTLASIERADGSKFGDAITGSSFADFLNGLGGDDSLFGLEGNDNLDGGDGTDTVDGGGGTDTCGLGETYVSCELFSS